MDGNKNLVLQCVLGLTDFGWDYANNCPSDPRYKEDSRLFDLNRKIPIEELNLATKSDPIGCNGIEINAGEAFEILTEIEDFDENEAFAYNFDEVLFHKPYVFPGVFAVSLARIEFPLRTSYRPHTAILKALIAAIPSLRSPGHLPVKKLDPDDPLWLSRKNIGYHHGDVIEQLLFEEFRGRRGTFWGKTFAYLAKHLGVITKPNEWEMLVIWDYE